MQRSRCQIFVGFVWFEVGKHISQYFFGEQCRRRLKLETELQTITTYALEVRVLVGKPPARGHVNDDVAFFLRPVSTSAGREAYRIFA